MKGYFSIFKMHFILELQYRAYAYSGILYQIFMGLISLMVYVAFYQGGGELPMNFSQLATYIWLGQAFSLLVNLMFQDWDLALMVRDGAVAYELVRPYNLYFFWFLRLMAGRISALTLRLFPVLFVAILLPEPYGLSAPQSLLSLILGILCLLLAFVLATALSMVVYIMLFRVFAAQGPFTILAAVSGFFSGALIPLPLMPDFMQRITALLPFRYLADFPFRVYMGMIPQNQALFGILIQAGWILLLMVPGFFLFQIASRKVSIQGG